MQLSADTFKYYAGWADKIQGKTIPAGMLSSFHIITKNLDRTLLWQCQCRPCHVWKHSTFSARSVPHCIMPCVMTFQPYQICSILKSSVCQSLFNLNSFLILAIFFLQMVHTLFTHVLSQWVWWVLLHPGTSLLPWWHVKLLQPWHVVTLLSWNLPSRPHWLHST